MKSSEEVIQIVGRGMVEIGNMWGWGVVKVVSEILPRGVNDWYTWGRKEGEMVRLGMGGVEREARKLGWGFCSHAEFYGINGQVFGLALRDGVHLSELGCQMFVRDMERAVKRCWGNRGRGRELWVE